MSEFKLNDKTKKLLIGLIVGIYLIYKGLKQVDKNAKGLKNDITR